MRNQMDNNNGYITDKTYSIVRAIETHNKFLLLTRKYFEVYKIKEEISTEEIYQIFKDFVYLTIDEKFKAIETPTDVRNLKNKVNVALWRLKQRWAKLAIESLEQKGEKLLKKEYLELKKEYMKNGEILNLDIKKPEDIISLRTDFLSEWSSNISYNASDYPYLSELSEKKINSAFSHDLVMTVIDVLREEYDYDLSKLYFTNPSGLAPGIFSPIQRGRKSNTLNVSKVDDFSFKSGEYDTKNEDGLIIDVSYEFSANPKNLDREALNNIEPLRTDLVNEDTAPKAITKLFLDKQDLAIIRFAYSYSYMNTYKLYLSDILKYLGLSATKLNYQNIENRLLKLPFYTFYTKKMDNNGEVKSETTFNLFSRIHIEKSDKNRKVVQITKAYVEEIEKRSAEMMYKSELKRLKSHQAIDLAYFLEGRRSYLISMKENIRETYFKFDLDFLKWYVHLNNKKSFSQQIKEIKIALDEIKKNQFLIKDYKVLNSTFEILFYDDTEKRTLLLNNIILSLPNHLG